jgi:predicted Zn-dependent peptidase
MVQDQALAARIGTYSGYPADVDPGLFLVFALPNSGVSLSDLAQGIDEQLQQMRSDEVSDQELARVKTKARAQLLRGLDSNLGLARTLARSELLDGDWRAAFWHLEKIEDVQAMEIQDVVSRFLVPEKMTEARLVNESRF